MAILKKYNNSEVDFNNVVKENFIGIVQKVDLINHDSLLFYFDVERNATYGESLDYEISKVNGYINEIYEMPIKLDIKLVEILDDIKKSKYHETMIQMKKIGGFTDKNITMKGESIAEILYEYHRIFFTLKEYMISNKIPITIEDI